MNSSAAAAIAVRRACGRLDAVVTVSSAMAAGFGTTDLLLDRRTYQDFFAFWPEQTDGDPFTAVLDEATTYVASTTLSEPLPWQNSVLLPGGARESVAAPRETGGDAAVPAALDGPRPGAD